MLNGKERPTVGAGLGVFLNNFRLEKSKVTHLPAIDPYVWAKQLEHLHHLETSDDIYMPSIKSN